MSAYIVIKKATPHPLDASWAAASEALSNAEAALEALGDDFTDEQLNAAGDARTWAILAIQALPARNIDDVLVKLDAARSEADDHVIRNDCSLAKISDELCDVLNAALAPAASPADWNTAVENYEAAKATYDAADAMAKEPANIDELVVAMYAAMDRLADCPAPDHAALAFKIALLRDRYDGSGLPDDVFATWIADVCRLGGLEMMA